MESFWGWMLESSLLILIVLGIRRIFAGRVQYSVIQFLWVMVFLRFLIPVNLISTPYSAGNVFQSVLSSVSEKTSEKVQQEGKDIKTEEPGKEVQFAVQEESLFIKNQTAGVPAVKKSGKLEKSETVRLAEDTGAQGEEKKQNILKLSNILKILRASVSVFLLLCFIVSNCALTLRLKRERVFFRKKENLSVYRVAGIKSPCLYGLFRPAIYIPENLRLSGQISNDEIEQILLHEYTHYRHRDHLLSVLRMILTAVYFFDPFLLYAVSCSYKDTELFCDEAVIGRLGEENRFSYGRLLIRLAGGVRMTDFRYAMLPISGRGRELEKRIRVLGKRRHYSKKILIPLVLIAAVGFSVTCSAGTVSFAGIRGGISRTEAGEDNSDKTAGKEGTAVMGEETDMIGSSLPESSDDTGSLEENEIFGGLARQSFVNMGAYAKVSENSFGADFGRDMGVEKIFDRYIELFAEAVNTGNTDKLHLVLEEGSEAYTEQCKWAKNYHERGIREKVKKYQIISIEVSSAENEVLHTDEVFKVTYADSSKKILKQNYVYTCKYTENGWRITNIMDEDDAS